MDSTILSLGIPLDAALIEGNTMLWRPNIYDPIREISEIFIIDPATYRFHVKESRESKNFCRLPYVDGIDFEKLYGSAQYRYENFVKPCINFQMKNHANLIVAPYFFTVDIYSSTFNVNLSMVSDAIQYLNENKINLPLFLTIAVDCKILENPQSINNIVGRYVSDYSSYVEGFFILIESLDCKKNNPVQLYGLASLVKQLSYFKKLAFLKQLGSFGEILCALGASGYIAGPDIAESFSIKNLEPRKGFRPPRRIYVPELFSYLIEEDAKKIGYSCGCRICNGSFPVSEKLHFFQTKIDSIKELSGLEEPARTKCILEKLKTAVDFARDMIKKYAIDFNPTYLRNWIEILSAFKDWAYKEKDEIEIEELLRNLD